MSRFSLTDLTFTDRGDFVVDANGDLESTEDVFGKSLIQEIRSRLKAEVGDWKAHPQLGVGLNRFLGLPTNETTASKIILRITETMSNDGLLLPTDMEIVPIILEAGVILFRMFISTENGELALDLTYDSNNRTFVGL